MKHAVTVGTIAAVLMSAGLVAQGRNFSGTWTIDSEKTMAAGGGTMGGGRGGARAGGDATMARRVDTGTGGVAVAGGGGGGGVAVARSAGAGGVTGTVLTVDTKSFTIAQGQTTTTYPLDGSVTDLNNPTRKTVAKASWQGDKIAIETTAEGPNGPIVTHTTWYIEAEWLVRETSNPSSVGADGQPVVRKTYYKKG